jgi:four helix bundle protein
LQVNERKSAIGPKPQSRNARGFKDIVAWQKADALASLVFRTTSRLPTEYRWLTSQCTRAAISVPANIAEGHGRGGLAEFLRFLDIARGSLAELEYYIHFLSKENLLPSDQVDAMAVLQPETARVLSGLWLALKQKSKADWDRSGPAVREEPGDYFPAGIDAFDG